MVIEWLLEEDVGIRLADPQDGGEPLAYWWDDMRPGEVLDAVQEAYARGLMAGRANERIRLARLFGAQS